MMWSCSRGISITDAGRARDNQNANDPAGLGRGYAFYAAGLLHEALPGGKLAVHNRAIGGNRITDLQQRWQVDTLDVEPNVLSVLIGANDTWHGTGSGVPENGVPLDRYEMVYRQILTEAQDHLPGLKLVLCEPFIMPCGAVNDLWFPEFTERREMVEKSSLLNSMRYSYRSRASLTKPRAGQRQKLGRPMACIRRWQGTCCSRRPGLRWSAQFGRD